MNYNEFVCECVMRLGAAINPDKGGYRSEQCLARAVALAETLVKEGFMSPTFEVLRRKFEVYEHTLQAADENNALKGDGKLDVSAWNDVGKAIQSFIEAKNDFYETASLLMPELIEARKRGAYVVISSAAERVLEFFDENSEFSEFGNKEVKLLENLKRRKEVEWEAQRLHERLVASKRAEGRFKKRWPVWKTASCF